MNRLIVGISVVAILVVGASYFTTSHSFDGSTSPTVSLSASTVTTGTTTTSILTTSTSCVKVGEPLYPATSLVPLNQFVSNMQETYQVTVNSSAGMVVLHTNGAGVGSSNSSTLTVPIVSC